MNFGISVAMVIVNIVQMYAHTKDKKDANILRKVLTMAKKDNYKIQVGDKLYQNSKAYGRIFEWEVIEIYLEAYLSGYKTRVKCFNGSYAQTFFASDIVDFFDTKEETEQAIIERQADNG